MALKRGSAEARVLIEGEETVSKIVEDVKRKVATMADATRKNTEATKALREGWRMTATGISSVINLAQQAAQAAQAIGEHAREGARSLEVSARFTRLFAADLGGAEGVMGRLVEASRGAMDETSVKEYALQTRRMGMDIDQTATLLELAGKMSAETGQTYAEAADVMFKAIATGESGALKAIGIQIDLEKNIGAVAREWGVSAEAIDQSTRAQINYNEVAKQGMAALGEVDVSPVISNIDRVGAAYNNQISSMQELLADTIVDLMEVDRLFNRFRNLGIIDAATEAAGAMGFTLWRTATWFVPESMRTEDINSAVGAFESVQNNADNAAKALENAAKANIEAAEASGVLTEALTAEERAQRVHAQALRDAVTGEIESREATLQNTIAKAEYAQELGHLVLAEELFAQASQIATTTQDGEAEATRLATQAIVIKNRAMIELLETQLLMSEVELALGTDPKLEGYLPISPGEIAQLQSRIDVLKTHLSQVMTPEDLLVSPSGQPTRGRPARGGAARDDAAERERLQLVERFQQAREYYEERARLEKEAAVEQRQEVDEAIRASQEKVKAQADAYKELMNAVTETSRQGLSDSISMMGQLGGEFEQLGFGVSNAASIVVGEVDRMNAAIRDFAEQGRSSGEAWEANAGAITSASGRIVAGMIKDTTSQAVVLSAFELAAGFASLGALNPVAATNHFIASALYAGVAGMSAAGGGASGGTGAGRGGRTAPRTASLGPAPARDEKKATAITINMSGAMVHGGNQQQFIRTLASEIQKETGAQQAPPDFMMG
jgi:tetratricopeptide (TPR) repeat protein